MNEITNQKGYWSGRSFMERNHYYFGKLLTVRDFKDEQSYFNEKRWMLNRYGLGWGVLAGLMVVPSPSEKQKVVITPGLALDAYGHEIRVCHDEIVDLTTATGYSPDAANHYFLSIKYTKCKVNPSPIPIKACEDYTEECEYNRIREMYQFVLTSQKLVFSGPLETLQNTQGCRIDENLLLEHPELLVNQQYPLQEYCAQIPLAAICYNPEPGFMNIDMSPENRKVAFSNEILYELLRGIEEQLKSPSAPGPDRRRHVPLLANTLPGMTYSDGKSLKIELGDKVCPKRITSDGRFIWITDSESPQIKRLDRRTSTIKPENQIKLDKPGWGIAFDGRCMWISHHNILRASEEIPVQPYGQLTRIDCCNLNRWLLSQLPDAKDVPDCQYFPLGIETEGTVYLKPLPGEIILHRGHIYVAHAQKRFDPLAESQPHPQPPDIQVPPLPIVYDLWITRIDPKRHCWVETINVPSSSGFEALSEIRGMVSDGDAIWITYEANKTSSDSYSNPGVVQRIRTFDPPPPGTSFQNSKPDAPFALDVATPERLVFDGTHNWVLHEDGATRVILDLPTRAKQKIKLTPGDKHFVAAAFDGAQQLWCAVDGDEAQVWKVNIHSCQVVDTVELVEAAEEKKNENVALNYKISDIQFDGNFIYVAMHREKSTNQAPTKSGIIYRLLP